MASIPPYAYLYLGAGSSGVRTPRPSSPVQPPMLKQPKPIVNETDSYKRLIDEGRKSRNPDYVYASLMPQILQERAKSEPGHNGRPPWEQTWIDEAKEKMEMPFHLKRRTERKTQYLPS